MADLKQTEADALLSLNKRRVDDSIYQFPVEGASLQIPLIGDDEAKTEFILDIVRGRIVLVKGSYQNRVNSNQILARLCMNGSGHSNPDGIEVGPTHLHTYREGYADKWAQELPGTFNCTSGSISDFLNNFLLFCSITDPPSITMDIFA